MLQSGSSLDPVEGGQQFSADLDVFSFNIGLRYYFAARVVDNFGNIGELSEPEEVLIQVVYFSPNKAKF